MLSVAVLPAVSRAVTLRTLFPDCKGMVETDQEVVPEADPEPPLLFDQVTWAMPTLSEAEPPMLMVLFEVT
jgi:hypothetical protein